MSAVARDFDLVTTGCSSMRRSMEERESGIVEIRELRDLGALESDAGPFPRAYLSIRGGFAVLRQRLFALCSEGKASSLPALKATDEVNDFAMRVDDVPVFLLHNVKDAEDIVPDLSRVPPAALEEATNASSVTLHFVESCPT